MAPGFLSPSLSTWRPLRSSLSSYSCGCALIAAWRTAGGPPFGYFLARFISNYAVMDVFIYAAAVSLVYVAQHQSERRERDLRESRLQTDLADARLTALRAQLQPHFLFNALNAITGLAMNREHEKLIRSVSALSDLLRRVLEGVAVPSTSLAREMEFNDRYLEIMAIRFGERLRIETDIAPQATHASVPSLILQPLVENAVLHGVGRTTGAVLVRVGARREGDALVLEVENREVREARETRENRDASTEAPEHAPVEAITPTRIGLGLASTRDRLAQLFGDDAQLALQDLAGGGTRATIRLPWSET